MFNSSNPRTDTNGTKLAERAASGADKAIKSTQRVANDALDSLSGGVEELRRSATPMLNRVGDQASAMARRSVDTVRESSQQLREKAVRAGDSTVGYIKDEPVKAILIAAATGAALMAVMSLLGGRSHTRD